MIPAGLLDGNITHLNQPHLDELEDAYREMPLHGRVMFNCPSDRLAAALSGMEMIGFIAIQINTSSIARAMIEVSAFKGKQGACYDTGRTVVYTGAAIAAMDDDNHVLGSEPARICEKTARIYGLPAYGRLLEVSDGAQELFDRLENDPAPFDCNTYEDDVRRTLGIIGDAQPSSQTTPLYYSGPFRVLITASGVVIRRGQTTLVPTEEIAGLIKKDGAVDCSDIAQQQAVVGQHLPTWHAAEGSLCLVDELPLAGTWFESQERNLGALGKLKPGLRERLERMIVQEDKYLLLTGSNPADQFGCCPSDEVGDAMKLVQSGILDAWSAPSGPDACPITMFAFAGEMKHGGDKRPEVTLKPDIRGEVAAAMKADEGARSAEIPKAPPVLRWILLIFVVVSLIVAVAKINEDRSQAITYVELLAEEPHDKLLVLVHPTKRCDFCLTMEAVGKELFATELAMGDMSFVMINYDDLPQADRQSLFSSSLLLVTMKDSALVEHELIKEAAQVFQNKETLRAVVLKAVQEYSSSK